MISVETLLERVEGIPEETAQRVIDAATAWLGRAISRYLGAPEAVEEFLLGNGSSLLMLNDPPQPDPDGTYTLSEVRVFEADYPGAVEDELTEGDDFAVRGRRIFRIPWGVWYRGHEYRFVYTRGYLEDEGPADWREAILQMCKLLWQEVGQDQIGLTSESLGDYSWTRAADRIDFVGLLPFVANVVSISRPIAIAG